MSVALSQASACLFTFNENLWYFGVQSIFCCIFVYIFHDETFDLVPLTIILISVYHHIGDYAGFPGCGLLRLHSTYRHDLKIYASDEGRVQMTAAAFAKVILSLTILYLILLLRCFVTSWVQHLFIHHLFLY